ncbi:claudin 10-like 2 isoform X1 [Hoplias malabaricus]|uniref:claudin 10-like 2 isoform X1 n=1 Tax=Hoplias malabaricus TaxID=27720 RepID=UPI0034632DBE
MPEVKKKRDVKMKKRVLQVLGFLVSTLGWFFVVCTQAMGYWRYTYIGGQGGSWIVKAAWYYSSLWKDCYTDTTAVDNCKEYDVLWVINPTNTAERGYIRAVRGLVLFGMALGLFAALFCFIGMECTYLGGRERTNDIILLTGCIFHFIGGAACAAGYCLYTSRLGRAAFVRLSARGALLRYQIGPPIYLGFAGSFCIVLGSVLYFVTVYRIIVPKREEDTPIPTKPMTNRTNLPLNQSKIQYNRDYTPSIHSSLPRHLSSLSSAVSRISSEMSDRDVFV